jgi:hypothetical protein
MEILEQWRLTRPRRQKLSVLVGLDQIYGAVSD